MAVCKNCGAEIEDKEVRCPFCGALQHDAAEEQYMDNLYKMNETMDQLDDKANAQMRKNILIKAGITLAIVLLATGIAAIGGFNREKRSLYMSAEDVKIIEDWYEVNIDLLNTSMENRDFKSVNEIMSNAPKMSQLNEVWEGYAVWETYKQYILSMESYLDKMKENQGMDVSYYYDDVYEYAIEFLGNDEKGSEYASITKAKRYYPEIVDEWRIECQNVLENDLGIPKEVYEQDVKELFSTGNFDYEMYRSKASVRYEKYYGK